MRDIRTAKKELKLLKRYLDELVLDYEYAQSEEDLGPRVHDNYASKIADCYRRYKEVEFGIRSLI